MLVKYWHPLTPLNYDYKILARAIAKHLDSVMEDLIGPQQSGFMKGHSSSTNIVKMKEIIAYLNKKNNPGAVIMVDFEKCFEYSAIEGTFKYFNFGERFIQWAFLLFNEFTICTQNNGFLSNFFDKKRERSCLI